MVVSLILLMMGLREPETCRVKKEINTQNKVLHPLVTLLQYVQKMHGMNKLKKKKSVQLGYDSTGFVWVTAGFSGGVIVTSKAGFCLVWFAEQLAIALNCQFLAYIISLSECCSTEVGILLVSLDSSFPILESKVSHPEV